MLVKTRGIVLKYIRYRETSIIANIYTESQGLQSYLVNSVRSSRYKRTRIALFQPLTLLDMVVYSREGKSLNRLSEVRCSHPFTSIPLNPKKTAIALFVVEILSKTLKEQTENPQLFDFIWRAVQQFDLTPRTAENFHLIFLVRLAKYLGFSPHNSHELFDELKFEMARDWVHSSEADRMNQLLASNFSTTLTFTNTQRASLLSILLSLYRLHVEQFGNVKSVTILNQVFQ